MNVRIRSAIVTAFRRAALPLGWYYIVTLGIPLANGGAGAGRIFVSHALVVLVVPPALIVVASTLHEMARALSAKPDATNR